MKVNVVVFLAFFMTRPSDSAPRSELYDESNIRNLVFPEDKSYYLYFFCIKNDTSRTGFEVRVTSSGNAKKKTMRRRYMFI